MRTSTIAYGSLRIPLSGQRQIDEAFAYLSRDRVERSLIERLEHSPVQHRIVIDHRHDDSYRPWTHTIRWDPTSAMRTTNGGRQSPALAPGHCRSRHRAVDEAAAEHPRLALGRVVEDAGLSRRYALLAVDEIDLDRGHVSWKSPIGRALLRRKAGDEIALHRPSGEVQLTGVAVEY